MQPFDFDLLWRTARIFRSAALTGLSHQLYNPYKLNRAQYHLVENAYDINDRAHFVNQCLDPKDDVFDNQHKE